MLRSFLFMLIFMMADGTGMADGGTPCSVDSVPIQIIRKLEYPVTTISEVDIHDMPPGFSAFVAAVTKHLEAKLAQEKLCLNNSESKEKSLLKFVTYSVDSSPRPFVPPLEPESSESCRMVSPWIDIVIVRRPVPWVRAIIRYNERQLLADQAVLAGVRNVPSGVALPLAYDEFNRYADLEYAYSEIHHHHVTRPIEERVPPDLLWLFRRARQDDYPGDFPMAAKGSMRKAMKVGAEGYTKIVTGLIDRCFAAGEADIHYNSIAEVTGLMPLSQYRIESSISVKPIVELEGFMVEPIIEHD